MDLDERDESSCVMHKNEEESEWKCGNKQVQTLAYLKIDVKQ